MTDKAKKAEELFLKGYGCSQAILGAFATEAGIDHNTAMRIASGFGGGMGRMREVCGTMTGAFMVLGLIYGFDEPSPFKKGEIYARIKEISDKFKEKNQTIICRELLNLPEPEGDPTPTERTKEFYAKRPCGELVRIAADIAWQVLFEEK